MTRMCRPGVSAGGIGQLPDMMMKTNDWAFNSSLGGVFKNQLYKSLRMDLNRN